MLYRLSYWGIAGLTQSRYHYTYHHVVLSGGYSIKIFAIVKGNLRLFFQFSKNRDNRNYYRPCNKAN